MKALTVIPSQKNSVKLSDLPEPKRRENELLVEMLRVGICGTDREIVSGLYGEAPPGSKELVLGHESLGRVLEAPENSGFEKGDHVVGIVRHPDPVPCPYCARGEWDMCSNDQYTEHGIKGIAGFAQERYVLDPKHSLKVSKKLGEAAVLLEPATVLAKAWEQIERIGARSYFEPTRVLVTGGGPVGFLAALMGRQRNMETVLFNHTHDAVKQAIVEKIGATWIENEKQVFTGHGEFDIILECTGAPAIFFDVIKAIRAGGIVCLTGISSGGKILDSDPGSLNRTIVLENEVVFGSVNANKRHYEQALASLEKADPAWLASFFTHRTPLSEAVQIFQNPEKGIKQLITGAPL